MSRVRVSPRRAQQSEAVVRHHDVSQNQIGGRFKAGSQRLSVGHGRHVIVIAQKTEDVMPHIGVVVAATTRRR